MSDEVAYVLITVFVVLPLVSLVFWVVGLLGRAWALQSAMISLPLG